MKKILILLFIALNLTVSATDFYVSSSGNDAANGLSESTPWKSISKVNSAFSSLQPGDKILFKRGDTFYGTLTITASGVAGNPVIIGAYGSGSNPVITGLTGLSSWTSEGNGIYSRTVSCESTPNLVLFNGTPRAIGRWPNTGSMTFESHSGTTSITDNQLSGSPNWTNAELAIRANDYTLSRIRITNHSGTTISFASGSLSSEPRNGYGYWIQNDIKTLDVTGEWYYDGSKLYMYFGASNPENYSVKIATLEILAKIKAARYVIIENLNFSGANNSGLTCEGYNVNNITIQNCTIANTGSYGTRFADPNYTGSYITINNCIIENSLSAGINITGNYKYNTITGNTLRNIGYIEGMGSNYCGMTVFGDNTTIEHNTINNVGYNGIYPFCSNLSIKNNVISNFCTVIDDGGGIFMGDWADKTNKVITGNIIYNGFGAPNGGGTATPRLARGIFIDSSTGSTGSKYIEVTYNTVFNCAWDGIYITDGNNYVTVENNTIYNNFLQFQLRNWNTAYSESNIIVRNNIFYAKSANQTCYRFQTITNTAFSAFGSSNNNFISRPIDDDDVFFTYQPSAEWVSRTLENWRSFSGQDINSVKAPVVVTDTANIDFYYNTGTTDKVIILDRPMIDPKGRRYSASVTLSPFSSVILMVDPNPPEPVPVTLTVNAAPVDAAISVPGENDWYKFQTGSSGSYSITTYGSTDTYMYLYQNDKSTLITENDDGAGSGYNAKITQNLNASTVYYIRVKAYSVNKTGSYSIDVKYTPTITTLTVDSPATAASISVGGENDWFKFLTGTAGTYAVQTYGSSDTYMYLYQSDQTTLIAENDDGAGSGYNSKITQNLSANTWYYVKVKLYRTTATGDYSIDVKDLTPTTLIVGAEATQAAISVGGENDWYKFFTGVSGNYSIQTFGSSDTYMYLYGSDQSTLLAQNDDGTGTGYNAKITQSLNANTWYYVRVRLYNSTATGAYSISVKDETAVILTVNAVATEAAISNGGEVDWYKFKTSAAGAYAIQTYGNSDTYMYLYMPDQASLINLNDDGGEPGMLYNSKLTENLAADTWYFVKIKLYNSTATGSYSIDVSDASAVTLIVGAPATDANINPAGENDWFRFQTSTAGSYSIQTSGSSDTYMYLYASDKTTLISENDDGAGVGYNAKITADLSAGSLYYVKVRLYKSTVTGYYAINVTKNESSKGSGEYMKAAPNPGIIKKDDLEKEPDALLIYPNPAIDKITVEYADELIDMIRLEIISASGKKVYMEQLSSDQQIYETININELPAGLYFVRIVKANQVITGKFIKRR